MITKHLLNMLHYARVSPRVEASGPYASRDPVVPAAALVELDTRIREYLDAICELHSTPGLSMARADAAVAALEELYGPRSAWGTDPRRLDLTMKWRDEGRL